MGFRSQAAGGEGEQAFEDGTLNYLNIPAIEIGLRHLQNIGIDIIHDRVSLLTSWLLDNLIALRHGNGKPVAIDPTRELTKTTIEKYER